MKDRSLAARLQSAASTQFAGLRAAGRVCTNTSADAGMKKASTRLLEQETQTPSPAPDLHIGIGTANGATSPSVSVFVVVELIAGVCEPLPIRRKRLLAGSGAILTYPVDGIPLNSAGCVDRENPRRL